MSPARKYLWEFGEFRFDSERQQLMCGVEVKNLPPKVAALLLAFVRSEGRVLKKDELLTALWPDAVVEEANLSQTVFLLRKILKECGVETTLIEAVPKVGYRFSVEARLVTETPVAEPARTEALAEPVTPAEPVIRVAPVTPVAPAVSWWQSLATRRSWQLAAVAVVAVLGVLTALAVRSLGSRSRGPLVASVAVLPFVEMNAEKPDQALSLGLADLLISRLGVANAIEVRPTAAVLRYLEKTQDAFSAGRELGVEAVVTGRLYRQGDTLRLTCQLVRVSDEKTLWTTTIERPFVNLFEMEDTLTAQVAHALVVPLHESTAPSPTPQGTQNLAAYQLYLKGRYFWNKRTWEWKMKAAESFEQAIQLDPNYAAAYAGLADCYSLRNTQMTPKERLAKALPAVERALQLNERQAEAHASRGFIRYKLQGDWAGAEVALKRAIELNPNYATAWHWYGECLGLLGRGEEALRTIQQAERLDPLSLPIKSDVGLVYMRRHQYEQAVAKFKETLTLDPKFNRVYFDLTLVYLLQGRFEQAVEAHLDFLDGSDKPSAILTEMRQTYQQAGEQAYWRKLVELKDAGKANVGIRMLALIRLRFGTADQALADMEKSVTNVVGEETRLMLKASPEFDALRQQPRFQQLLQRAGFANG